MTMDFVKPAGDPQIGNLETPVNSSAFSKALINNLPAYRAGLSPIRRGIEVGMAHGYLLFGPFYLLGPLRGSGSAAEAGAVGAAGLVMVLTIGLSMYANTMKLKPVATTPAPNPPADFASKEGWSEFAGGFLVGGVGGAFVAYWLVASELLQMTAQTIL